MGRLVLGAWCVFFAATVQAQETTAAGERVTVVTGSRTERFADEAVVPTEVLTQRDIQRAGARDLGELLQTHPGVEQERTFRGTGLRLQGLDPEYVTVLVDGRRVTGRVGGTLDLSRFTLNDIERVEIVKGPAAALYGADAMGGVVNLVTRKDGPPLAAGASVSFGMRNDLDLRVHGSAKQGDFRVRAAGGRRTAMAWDLDPSDATTSGSAFMILDATTGITWTPSDRVQLTLDADYVWKDSFGMDGLPTGAVFDRRFRDEIFNARLSASYTPFERTRISADAHLSLFRDQLLQDQHASRSLDQYQESWERKWEANLQVDQKLGDSHLLTAGLEQSFFFLTAPRIENGVMNRSRSAALIQDEWQVFDSPKLVLLPGVRIDLDSQFGAQPSPRLAVRYEPVDRVGVRVAYGWGFRAPSFQELALFFENPAVGYVVEGNPALQPERSQGLTVSVDWAATDDLQLGASAFRTELRELITIATLAEQTPESPLRFGYANVGHARTEGGELNARIRVWGGLWLDLGYGLTHAIDLDANRLLEGRAMHRITGRLSGRIRPLGVEASLRAAWNGPRWFYPDLDGNGTLDAIRVAGYTDVDARLSRRFFTYMEAFVGIKNALDAGDPLYLPLPPRQVYGGLSVEL